MILREANEVSGAPSLAAIAIHAYIYSYPLVLADMHRRVTTSRPGRGGRGLASPANTLSRTLDVAEAGDFAIAITSNTAGWLDLREGPVRIHVPETRRRFSFATIFDGFGMPFASVGTREGGSREREYLLYGPSRAPDEPGDAILIEAPGFWAFFLARSWPAVNDERGPRSRRYYAASQRTYLPERDSMLDTRLGARAHVERMSAEEYWSATAELLALHPAPRQDWKMLIALAALGIRPGLPFELAAQDELTRGALRRALPIALSQISDVADHIAVGTFVESDNPYLERAGRAQLGFAREYREDIYESVCLHDEAGELLAGDRRYELCFAAHEVPKTTAFWTIDIYDTQHPRNLPAHSVHGPSLTYEADGSIRIALGPNASDYGPNALEGLPPQYLITVRTFLPSYAMLDESWHVPAPQAQHDDGGALARSQTL